MLNNIPAIDVIRNELAYTSERQAFIANNIANINTPKKKSKDLLPFSLSEKMVKVSRTNSKHIGNNKISNFTSYGPETGVRKLDGNNISLEQESMKLNQNNLDHQQAIGVYSKIISMLNTATHNGK